MIKMESDIIPNIMGRGVVGRYIDYVSTHTVLTEENTEKMLEFISRQSIITGQTYVFTKEDRMSFIVPGGFKTIVKHCVDLGIISINDKPSDWSDLICLLLAGIVPYADTCEFFTRMERYGRF